MLAFEIVDVFAHPSPASTRQGVNATPMPYSGNQLAVVYDGEGLSTGQMQAIAQEFGFSETSFVLPVTTSEADYRARIFTPGEELPFAGHPTIGSAIAAVASGRVEPNGGRVVQECGAGLMTVDLDGASAKLTSTAISVGDVIAPEVAAGACGLDASCVIGTAQTASAGLPHNFVRLDDADVIAATSNLGELDLVYPFSFDPETYDVHARLFHNTAGEDPATGSAAVALGVYLVEQGLISGEGVHGYRIRQGAEMGRPSVLYGEVVVEGGRAVSASVAGSAVQVAKGELVTLPVER
ncbi:PhzF family phenazine biosynthesis protein [Glycomyces sp. L485]|uniref:PhzF family phenazine biosynthesis protein n=1 Tax=Glycomyces sp. L485 TaxID=2909235 RepID=UPI001F4B1B1A|nr:PhzF family phenazine biosynthesis protein [Glycomyces sp. L485]MCH7231680.1 PhzF family phenazine biosynthesis protein [Glycomyces sp. L485]